MSYRYKNKQHAPARTRLPLLHDLVCFDSILVLIEQVLSNKKLMSATHRVVRKPAAHRHSFAFFFCLHGDKWVEPLPEFTDKVGEAPRYRGFFFGEYLNLRKLNKTHPPSRPEDVISITHYEI
ncbi:hypothetical protein EJB05_03215, partial [Eragrostis curvula]